jgi:hypothetical protein
VAAFDQVFEAITPELERAELHAQDRQSCLCEYSKYATSVVGPSAGISASNARAISSRSNQDRPRKGLIRSW